MCFMASAMELMWPGVPVTACATIHPRRSKTPAERSPASRTMEVKEVRIKAAACSFTTPMRRFQQMSRVMGSNLVLTRPSRRRRTLDSALARRKSSGGLPWLEDQGEAAVHADERAGTGHRGRLTLLDDSGTCEGRARVEGVAVIHGCVHITARLGEVRRAPSLRCRRGRRGGNSVRPGSPDGDVGHGPGDHHAEVERLDGHAQGDTAVERAIGRLVALDDDAQAGRGEMARGQLDL